MLPRSKKAKEELTIEWVSSSPPSLTFSFSSMQERKCGCFTLFKKKKSHPRIDELKEIIDKINSALTLMPHARKDSNQVAYFDYQLFASELVITGFHNKNGAQHSLDKEKHPMLLLEQDALNKWLTTAERDAIRKMPASSLRSNFSE